MTTGEPLPAAVPAAWSTQAAQTPAVRASGRIGATTTPSSPGVSASPPRVGRRGLNAVRDSLSARDRQLLQGINSHRYLTTKQVEAFYFTDHATPLTAARVCRRVLRRLAELHVVECLERRIGGVRAGSASYVWQIGPVGDRLLRAPGQPRTRRHEPGLLFLDHCLAIADAHVAVATAHRAGELELVTVSTEPDCWRSFLGVGGARQELRPDLYLETGDPQDASFLNCWFLEIDLGTENPARLLAKCARYEAYRASGQEQLRSGGYPLVVWVMRDEPQAARLRTALGQDNKRDQRLYRVTTPGGLADVIRAGAL